MTSYTPEKTIPTQCHLGESPLWHSQSQTMFWLDIKQQKLWHMAVGNDDSLQSLPLTKTVSFVAETNTLYELLVTSCDGVEILDTRNGQFTLLAPFPADEPEGNRPNDGGISPDGQLYFGTMDNEAQKHSGNLYSFDGELTRLKSGLWVPNLFAFLTDNEFFYADSLNNRIDRWKLNAGDSERTEVWHTDENIYPDGGCLDSENGLWSAQWGSSRVVRYSLDSGEITDEILLPETQITSCCFVGDKQDQLLITAAAEGTDSDNAGNSYLCRVPYRGVDIAKFDLSGRNL